MLLSHDDLHQNTRPSNIFRDMCHKGRNLSIHEMSYIVCIIHIIVSILSRLILIYTLMDIQYVAVYIGFKSSIFYVYAQQVNTHTVIVVVVIITY